MNEKIMKAKLLKIDIVRDPDSYLGKRGFVEIYWFSVGYDSLLPSVVPFILDQTAEIYEPYLLDVMIYKPLLSYAKNQTNIHQMIGVPIKVLVSLNKYGGPAEVISIIDKPTN